MRVEQIRRGRPRALPFRSQNLTAGASIARPSAGTGSAPTDLFLRRSWTPHDLRAASQALPAALGDQLVDGRGVERRGV